MIPIISWLNAITESAIMCVFSIGRRSNDNWPRIKEHEYSQGNDILLCHYCICSFPVCFVTSSALLLVDFRQALKQQSHSTDTMRTLLSTIVEQNAVPPGFCGVSGFAAALFFKLFVLKLAEFFVHCFNEKTAWISKIARSWFFFYLLPAKTHMWLVSMIAALVFGFGWMHAVTRSHNTSWAKSAENMC